MLNKANRIQADKAGAVCYLESSHDINVKIYGKMGFEFKKKIYLQREANLLHMDIMVRYPKTIEATETVEKKIGASRL